MSAPPAITVSLSPAAACGPVVGVGGMATQIVPAVLLSVLLVGVRRGRHVARVGMCIVAVVLTASCSLAIGTISSPPSMTGTAFQRELTQRSDDTEPWVTAFIVPALVGTIGGPMLAAALLLTPAANRFFRDSRSRRPE
jgi:cobalamin synthase